VNTGIFGYGVTYGGGSVALNGPGAFDNAADANAALEDAPPSVAFTHTGGPIGVYLYDYPYSDNSGSGGTFKLIRLPSPLPTVSIAATADPGLLTQPAGDSIDDAFTISRNMPDDDYSQDLSVSLAQPLGTAIEGGNNDYTLYYQPTGWEGTGTAPALPAPLPTSGSQVDIPANYSGVTVMAQLLDSEGFNPTASIAPSIEAASGYELSAAVPATPATATTTNAIPGKLDVDTVGDGLRTGTLARGQMNSPGAFVPRNSEDADHNGQPDYGEKGPIAGELQLLNIKLVNCTGSGTYSLVIPQIFRVWSDEQKTPGGAINSGQAPPILPDGEASFWVEGFASAGSGEIQLLYKGSQNSAQQVDEVKVTIFQMLGPLNVPQNSTYHYTVAAAGLPQNAGWLAAYAGSIVDASGTAANILWGAGPTVGYAEFLVDADYIWELPVTIVEVEVETPNDAFSTGKASDAGIQMKNGSLTRVITSATPNVNGGNGINWAANVTLTGPGPAHDWGVKYINIGFMQEISPYEYASYGPQGATAPFASFSTSTKVYWDTIDDPARVDPPFFKAPTVPLYDRSSSAVITSPVANHKYEINSSDSPDPGVPVQFMGLNLYSTTIDWLFSTYVVAETTDSENDSASLASNVKNTYTAMAYFNWDFDATGSMANPTISNSAWTPSAYAGVKLYGPAAWSVPPGNWYAPPRNSVPFGYQPKPQGTPPQTPTQRFNYVLNNATWSQ